MRHWVAIAALVCVVAAPGAWAITLTHGGESGYVIVTPEHCPPVVHTAAADLQAHLAQITGATLPIQTDAAPLSDKAILLGETRFLAELGVQPDWEALGDEGYLITTQGKHLVIVGGPLRGTAYGVYAFLDEHLGCRWFTPKVSRIPKRPTLNIGDIHDTYTPPLIQREPFWVEARDQDWGLRNRVTSAGLDEKHCGGFVYLGVHTFYTFVPPDTYFSAHPEYYSLIDGTRTHERAQLCLTNPDVLKRVIEGVKERLRTQPNADVVDVSQNDWDNPCQCDACQAIAKAEKSEAGPIIWFVNQVADAVREEFPDRFVGTLAYHWTERAPLTLVPRDNVAPRLCSISSCFSHPLGTCSSKSSGWFVRDIKEWQKKTSNLFIWDYTTNFGNYIQPFPNLYVLQPNIQFFIHHGVSGVFEQGNYQGNGCGEMSELRTYLLARLLWKPDRDVDKEIDEFLKAYYGPAAKHVRKYIDFLHDRAAASEEHIGIGYPPTGPFFSGDFVSSANAILEKAEKAVKREPELLSRVQKFRMPVYYVTMMRLPEEGAVPALELERAKMACEKFFATADTLQIAYINEGMMMGTFKERYLARLEKLTPAAP
jgi:hypothetical protein